MPQIDKLKFITDASMAHHALGSNNPGFCEHCERNVDFVINTPSMTAYYSRGTGEDPNRDLVLCLLHAEEYIDHMNDKYEQYYASLMYYVPK